MNKTRGMGCEQKCVSSAWAQWPLFPTFPPVFKTQPQNLLLHWNALHKIQVTLCTLFLRMPRICLHESRKKVKSFSPVRLFVTPWTVAYQAPPSMEFSKQEYWSGLPFPFPGDLPNAWIKPGPPALQETWVQSLGWKDPLEKGMATHSSILASRIP